MMQSTKYNNIFKLQIGSSRLFITFDRCESTNCNGEQLPSKDLIQIRYITKNGFPTNIGFVLKKHHFDELDKFIVYDDRYLIFREDEDGFYKKVRMLKDMKQEFYDVMSCVMCVINNSHDTDYIVKNIHQIIHVIKINEYGLQGTNIDKLQYRLSYYYNCNIILDKDNITSIEHNEDEFFSKYLLFFKYVSKLLVKEDC